MLKWMNFLVLGTSLKDTFKGLERKKEGQVKWINSKGMEHSLLDYTELCLWG